MGRASLRISKWFLREVLTFPCGTEMPDTFETWVEHPDIPDGTERVNPSFHRDQSGTVVFEAWNPIPREPE